MKTKSIEPKAPDASGSTSSCDSRTGANGDGESQGSTKLNLKRVHAANKSEECRLKPPQPYRGTIVSHSNESRLKPIVKTNAYQSYKRSA